MKKSILIVGVGEGIGIAVAEKFGNEGYSVGLINRNSSTGALLAKRLTDKGITAYSKFADVTDSKSFAEAILDLKKELGGVDVLLYNAAALKVKDIFLVQSDEFLNDFKINVSASLQSIQLLHEELKSKKGAFLITGGGLANYPNPFYGTLSLGKAALRNLSVQLHERLKGDNIYVATLTINNGVSAGSATHSPAIIAETFWDMAQKRNQAEVKF